MKLAAAALTVALTVWALLVANAASAQARPSAATDGAVHVQLLGLNDFHGQLASARKLDERPVGGAAVLVSYLRDAAARFPGDTLIVHAGDWVGASPPSSALLQDEPSIEVLNLLANAFCTYQNRLHPRCNVVGTPGNHEFDEGASELVRLVRGGTAKRGPFLQSPWRGARFPYVSATVLDRATSRTLFPAYVIKQLSGIKLAVIGAVLQETPSMVVAGGVQRVRFLPEAEAINRSVAQLRRQGIETIVVTIHQGGAQPPYPGPTRLDAAGPSEGLPEIILALDDAVDVVISGHAHAFSNALMKNKHGHDILVTQAWLAGGAFASIDLTIDQQTHDVVNKTATIFPTYNDSGPGLSPAADVAALVARAEQRVAPLSARVVGSVREALPQKPNAAGESALGNLIADAQRSETGADVALMNQGGIRSGLDAGEIRWGALFAIQPFSNAIVTMELTGAQLARVLEQQWESRDMPHMLQVSGLRYRWDPARPVGSRVVSVTVAGQPLVPSKSYRVALNSFLAGGGGGFSQLREGKNMHTGAIDLDLLVTYIERQGKPIEAQVEGRITTP
ncbi:MAG: ushA [Myxococcaceae bacterium]|nr:ushA [Myxococcaceae bacterium]